MPQRPCDLCGAVYEAKRQSSKFCGVVCRNRNARGAGASGGSRGASPTLSQRFEGEVAKSANYDAALIELVNKGREDSYLGAAALSLARLLDLASPAAAASLAKEYRATMFEATRDAVTVEDELEAIRRDAAAKRSPDAG